jgi:hypothetical protein
MMLSLALEVWRHQTEKVLYDIVSHFDSVPAFGKSLCNQAPATKSSIRMKPIASAKLRFAAETPRRPSDHKPKCAPHVARNEMVNQRVAALFLHQ